MSWKTTAIMAALAVIAAAIFAFWPTERAEAPSRSIFSNATTTEQVGKVIVIGEANVRVDVATTDSERSRGLGGRDGLTPNTGMLFVFDRDYPWAFWMKDMKFPIDIVWFDAKGSVVDIAPSVSPSTYPAAFTPRSPARYVVELPAGFCASHGIILGAQVRGL